MTVSGYRLEDYHAGARAVAKEILSLLGEKLEAAPGQLSDDKK